MKRKQLHCDCDGTEFLAGTHLVVLSLKKLIFLGYSILSDLSRNPAMKYTMNLLCCNKHWLEFS